MHGVLNKPARGDGLKIKALFTINLGKNEIQEIEKLGFEIIFKKENELEYSNELKNVEVMFTYNPFLHFNISKLENLRWIQLDSDGFDQIPVDYVKSKGILVTNNREGYAIPIAESIIASVLSIYRESYKFYKNKENRLWKPSATVLELHGSTIGIIGTGNIAYETAKRLNSFGVNILGFNTTGRKVEYFDECYSSDSIKNKIGYCDVVICLLPLTDRTYHFIDQNVICEMKDGVIFVNASRGKVVDEKSLIKYIKNGKIKASVLDVFEKEPLQKDNCLWNLDNAIITPHNFWISQNVKTRVYQLVFENMKRYKSGEKLKNIVNLDRGY